MSFSEPVVYAFRNHLPVTRIGGDAAWVDGDANRRRDRSAELSVVANDTKRSRLLQYRFSPEQQVVTVISLPRPFGVNSPYSQ